jgi:hypothetical protein
LQTPWRSRTTGRAPWRPRRPSWWARNGYNDEGGQEQELEHEQVPEPEGGAGQEQGHEVPPPPPLPNLADVMAV